MRLSSFHQTQATSSRGAQPSSAPAKPPCCGTYGPPLPAVVAPVPPSIIESGGCTSSGGGAICPLDFPSPRFAACRKIKSSSKRAGFTLVSNATQRAWEAVKPLRECQFGEVFLAVEVVYASSGRGWGRASSSPKYFAIKVRELVLDYKKKTAMKQHVHMVMSTHQFLSKIYCTIDNIFSRRSNPRRIQVNSLLVGLVHSIVGAVSTVDSVLPRILQQQRS